MTVPKEGEYKREIHANFSLKGPVSGEDDYQPGITYGDCCGLNGAWDDYPGNIFNWKQGQIHALCEVQTSDVGNLADVSSLGCPLMCDALASDALACDDLAGNACHI